MNKDAEDGVTKNQVSFHGLSEGWTIRMLFAAVASSSSSGMLDAGTIISEHSLLRAVKNRALTWVLVTSELW